MNGDQKRVLTVTSRAQWRAIGSPIRIEIMTTLEGLDSCTVAELAQRLERKVPSLYPHLATLEAAGFVEIASGGPGTNAPVAYRNTWDRIEFDMDSMSAEDHRQLDGLIGRMLRSAERRFCDHDLRTRADRTKLFQLTVGDTRLTREDLREVMEHFAAVRRIIRRSKRASPRLDAPIGETLRVSIMVGLMPHGERARQDLERIEPFPDRDDPGDGDRADA